MHTTFGNMLCIAKILALRKVRIVGAKSVRIAKSRICLSAYFHSHSPSRRDFPWAGLLA